MGADGTVSVVFDGTSSELPAGAVAELDRLAAKLKGDESLRLQVMGYSSGDNSTSSSEARRLSLFRALAVRTHLMKQGVRSTRMDVRAMGTSAADAPAPADRVDLVVQGPS